MLCHVFISKASDSVCNTLPFDIAIKMYAGKHQLAHTHRHSIAPNSNVIYIWKLFFPKIGSYSEYRQAATFRRKPNLFLQLQYRFHSSSCWGSFAAVCRHLEHCQANSVKQERLQVVDPPWHYCKISYPVWAQEQLFESLGDYRNQQLSCLMWDIYRSDHKQNSG